MKSILQGPKEEIKEENKYPYLGIWKEGGIVVLFTAPNRGTLVHEVLPKPRTEHSTMGIGSLGGGDYLEVWGEEDSFEPLKGKIVLSN